MTARRRRKHYHLVAQRRGYLRQASILTRTLQMNERYRSPCSPDLSPLLVVLWLKPVALPSLDLCLYPAWELAPHHRLAPGHSHSAHLSSPLLHPFAAFFAVVGEACDVPHWEHASLSLVLAWRMQRRVQRSARQEAHLQQVMHV